MSLQRWMIVGIILSSSLTVGCGQGMKGVSSGGTQGQQGGGFSGPDLDAIAAETREAEEAVAEATEAVGNVLKNGELNSEGISAAADASFGAQSLTGIPEKLRELLNKLFDKITEPVQKAKALINTARAQLAAQLSQLDPNNPAHAAAIAQIKAMMVKLDEAEAKITGLYKQLAQKIDVAIFALDGLIAKLSANPIGWIAVMELQEIRQVLVEFQAKLMAL